MELQDLLNKFKQYNNSKDDLDMIKRSYEFAEEKHKDQRRRSGEAYILHPLKVAIILTVFKADANTISAALLHDVIEDTDATKEDVIKLTNEYVYRLVLGVTKINLPTDSDTNVEAENTRRLLIGMTEDIRVILIKLADRIHNMRTLEYMSEAKQKEKSIETLDLFVPLASYLGNYKLKDELADLSLKYLNPELFKDLSERIKVLEKDRKQYNEEMVNNISKTLTENDIPNTLVPSTKNTYGVYRRMQEGALLHDVHDLFAIRIILDNEADCYKALGIIHKLYKPINERFKDYIANQKTNGYQSLHTTVFGANGNITQMRIRTKEMDEVSKLGIAHYWPSEKVEMNRVLKDRPFYTLLKEINELKDNIDYLDILRADILSSKIYVFTPTGEVIELPTGSTPVDFAYKIHTDIGNKLDKVYINHEKADLSAILKTNDIVNVTTNENSSPKEEWLKYAKTNHAKRNIRKEINKE